MKMHIVISSLLPLAAASLLTISSGVGAHGIIDGGGGKGAGAFAESPVSGVRIIRKKNYHKRPVHNLSSGEYASLAVGRETGNRFVAFDFQVPDGAGPLPHTHRNEWETFFVDQGEVTFTVGVTPDGQFIEQVVPAGTLVFGPQCPVHGFQNKSGKPARIFAVAMPAGLDVFFETSGKRVKNFNAPIPQISLEEIVRTAFWAEQRGDALHIPGMPPPACPPDTPADVISSITGEGRPKFEGPFGEERVSLLTREEAGNFTGATAFCGPGAPGRAGGSVDYSSFSLLKGDFPAPVTSENIEIYYTLNGKLSLKFGRKTVTVPALTYVEIQPRVPYSIANKKKKPVKSLAISVIAPQCPPGGPPGGQ